MKLDDWHADLWFGCLMNQSLGQWVIFSCYSRSTALTESFCFAVFTNHKTYLWSRLCLIKDETICCCPPCNSLNFGKGALVIVWCWAEQTETLPHGAWTDTTSQTLHVTNAHCCPVSVSSLAPSFFPDDLIKTLIDYGKYWLSVPLWYHAMRPYLILQIVYGIDDFSSPFLQGS